MPITRSMSAINLEMPKKDVMAKQLVEALAENEKLKKELAIQMNYSRMDSKDLYDALVTIDDLTKENETLKAK